MASIKSWIIFVLADNDFVGSVIIDKMQLTFTQYNKKYYSMSSIVLFSYRCILPYSLTMRVELKLQYSPL